VQIAATTATVRPAVEEPSQARRSPAAPVRADLHRHAIREHLMRDGVAEAMEALGAGGPCLCRVGVTYVLPRLVERRANRRLDACRSSGEVVGERVQLRRVEAHAHRVTSSTKHRYAVACSLYGACGATRTCRPTRSGSVEPTIVAKSPTCAAYAPTGTCRVIRCVVMTRCPDADDASCASYDVNLALPSLCG